uniref:Uncharacterized protein n=1 Tax=Arundo donax TaxID=35708 RepID=A0A0A9GF13_ARUDO
MLRKTTWALCNFCCYLPKDNFQHVKPALPVLLQLIHSKDEEILNNACWALSCLVVVMRISML